MNFISPSPLSALPSKSWKIITASRLFERIGKRITPTETGKEFFGYALHIVSMFDEMEKKIRNWDAIGTIRIGASITIGTPHTPSASQKIPV